MIVDGNRIRFVFDSWKGMIAIRILRRKIRQLTSLQWKSPEPERSDLEQQWMAIAIRILKRGKMKPA